MCHPEPLSIPHSTRIARQSAQLQQTARDRKMKTALRAVLCLLVLLVGGSGARLLAAPSPQGSGAPCTTPPPGPGWICVNGGWMPPSSPPAPPAPPTPQKIAVGERVQGTLFVSPGGPLLFELTADADGTLEARLDWDRSVDDLVLGFTNGTSYFEVGTISLTAGRTYLLRVDYAVPWDYVHFVDVPFVLTTSFRPGVSGACLGPDPFASLGGGTCADGTWWPPGLLPPGANPNPALPLPPPPPPLPPPPPTPSTGGCTTPDPFTALGGGACFNGGWWPPGLTPPGANPNPVPPPPPPPPPTPSTGGCTTPDPFVSLGGGTCFNGGWWPPGLLPLLIGRSGG
jgi:hypothetical protein